MFLTEFKERKHSTSEEKYWSRISDHSHETTGSIKHGADIQSLFCGAPTFLMPLIILF